MIKKSYSSRGIIISELKENCSSFRKLSDMNNQNSIKNFLLEEEMKDLNDFSKDLNEKLDTYIDNINIENKEFNKEDLIKFLIDLEQYLKGSLKGTETMLNNYKEFQKEIQKKFNTKQNEFKSILEETEELENLNFILENKILEVESECQRKNDEIEILKKSNLFHEKVKENQVYFEDSKIEEFYKECSSQMISEIEKQKKNNRFLKIKLNNAYNYLQILSSNYCDDSKIEEDNIRNVVIRETDNEYLGTINNS